MTSRPPDSMVPPLESNARRSSGPLLPAADIISLSRFQEACRGEPAAIKEFILQTAPFLRGTVVKVLNKTPFRQMQDRIDDLVQEVFERLLINQRATLKKYDPARASIRTFLYVYTKSRVLEWLRMEAGSPQKYEFMPTDQLAMWASRDPSALEQSVWKHGLQRLEALLQENLSELQLSVLELTLAGKDGEEIAEALGIASGYVFTIRQRNREQIARLWVQAFGEQIPIADNPVLKKTKR